MNIIYSCFSDTQNVLLLTGGFSFIISLLMHIKSREYLSLAFLVLTAICIFSFAALLDPFLNLWDERFHALAAKNMMNHPLMPTLYDDPIVDMPYDRWDRYHIWLHKQPLFLWQIAICFKIFGVSEFSLRLPDIVLGTILVVITYRSGKLLANKNVAYISSLFVISTIYILELIAGRQELEHNDFTFLVYISLSIWSFIEYYYSKKTIWIYLIGLFSGMAILCKWLVGLLVYFGWGFMRILQKNIKISKNTDFIISLSITLLVALPWQILTFVWYPEEAACAYRFNSIHFTTPLEGHGGNFWYHFNMFNTIYGKIASFLIIPGFIALYKKNKDKILLNSLLSMVIVVYLFFSLAATKMPSFTIVTAMIIFIAFATLFDSIIEHINKLFIKRYIKSLIFGLFTITIAIFNFDITFLKEKHTNNTYTSNLLNNKHVFKSLELPSNTVLFNVKGRHYIEAMFYTNLPSYNFIPSLEQYQDIKSKGKTIALFKKNNEKIPDYLTDDTSVIIIDKEIKGYE